MSTSELQDEEDRPDLPLSAEEEVIYAVLSEEELKEIDAALLEDCVRYSRKVARVVGTTFMSAKFRDRDIPLSCFVQRIDELVAQGKLAAEGNLNYMRYSEVRLPLSAGATPSIEGGAT